MKEFSREPTRIERIGAIIVSAILLTLCGVLTVIAVLSKALAITVIFGILFLASAFVFYRAAFTASRALTTRQLRITAWCALLLGGAAITFALKLEGSLSERLPSIGTGLSLLAAGIAGIWSQRDVA